jgi:hypothetical protein
MANPHPLQLLKFRRSLPATKCLERISQSYTDNIKFSPHEGPRQTQILAFKPMGSLDEAELLWENLDSEGMEVVPQLTPKILPPPAYHIQGQVATQNTAAYSIAPSYHTYDQIAHLHLPDHPQPHQMGGCRVH